MMKSKSTIRHKIFTWMFIVVFSQSIVAAPVYAQTSQVLAPVSFLPAVGSMVDVTQSFSPLTLKGIRVYPNNPFLLDFVVDKGDLRVEGDDLMQASEDLVEYFLASLTVPERDLWVNLSPYEQDRIVPQMFGQTKMGRDILAQDYYLKQLTSSLMHPDTDVGRAFWDKVRTQAQQKFGVTDVPVDTFNKVWIVPDEVFIYENQDTAYILESRLKVLTEKDFLALDINERNQIFSDRSVMKDKQEDLSADILKEVIVPALEHEVNYGEGFAKLRQVYHSLALAAWYKRHLQQGVLRHIYYDRNLIDGVDVEDKEISQKIYNQYVESFDVGVFNFVKEEYDLDTQRVIPRKYFSGGVNMDASALSPQTRRTGNPETLQAYIEEDASKLELLTVALNPQKKGSSASAASEYLTALSMAAVLSTAPIQAQAQSDEESNATEYTLELGGALGTETAVSIPLEGDELDLPVLSDRGAPRGDITLRRFSDQDLQGKAVLSLWNMATQTHFVYLVDELLLRSEDSDVGGVKNMIFIGEIPDDRYASRSLSSNSETYQKLMRFVWGERSELSSEDLGEINSYLSAILPDTFNGGLFVVRDEIDEQQFPRELRGSIDQRNLSSLLIELLAQGLAFDIDQVSELPIADFTVNSQWGDTFPGINGYFTANLVDHPDHIVWGLVDDGGNIIRANVASSEDDVEAIARYAELLAGLEVNQELDSRLFSEVLRDYSRNPLSNELMYTFFMQYLDIVDQYQITNRNSNFLHIIRLVHQDASFELLNKMVERMMSRYEEMISQGDVKQIEEGMDQYLKFIASFSGLSGNMVRLSRTEIANKMKGLMTQMVNKLSDTINFENPKFFEALRTIANYHLYMRRGNTGIDFYEQQNPQVVFDFLIGWNNQSDIGSADSNDISSFNTLAAEVLFYIEDAAQKKELTDIIVNNISEKLYGRISFKQNLWGLIPKLMTSQYGINFFNLLSDADKQQFVNRWVTFPISSDDVNHQGETNFIETLVARGDLTDSQRTMIRDYYEEPFPGFVQEAVDAYPSWQYEPKQMAAIARMIGKKELLVPLIERMTSPANLEQVLRVWNNYGFLVVETHEGVLATVQDALNVIEAFYQTVGDDVRHIDFLLEMDIMNGGNGFAGLRELTLGRTDLPLFLHELVSAVIHDVPAEDRFQLQKNWERMYELFERNEKQDVSDFFITSYAAVRSNNNEADVFMHSLLNGTHFIEKGLNLAIESQRPGYFNSLLVIMETFFMEQVDGQDIIPVYQANVQGSGWDFNPEQPILKVSEIVIGARDAQGRISELSYEERNYRLSYGEYNLIDAIEEVDPSGLIQGPEAFVPYDVAIETDASSLIEQSQRTVTPLEESKKNVGGILLDPALMRMNVTQGDEGMSTPQLTPEQIEDMSIDGIVPVMLGVQPITNPFMYLRN